MSQKRAKDDRCCRMENAAEQGVMPLRFGPGSRPIHAGLSQRKGPRPGIRDCGRETMIPAVPTQSVCFKEALGGHARA